MGVPVEISGIALRYPEQSFPRVVFPERDGGRWAFPLLVGPRFYAHDIRQDSHYAYLWDDQLEGVSAYVQHFLCRAELAPCPVVAGVTA